jgi:predicted DNA-binding transcriptional regulator YafY
MLLPARPPGFARTTHGNDMGKSFGQRSRRRSSSVTAARVARLYRFIRLLARGPMPRAVLLRRLELNQRGFYRDIELLRAVGIRVRSDEGRYSVTPGFDAAVNLLPFPDPQLSLGEAQRLARGNTAAHRALRRRVEQITRAKGNSR